MRLIFYAAACCLTLGGATASDWPEWGGSHSKNMVSDATGLPVKFEPGKKIKGSDDIDMATTKNCKFAIPLGSQSYGTPTIAGGKIFVGTNNEQPRDPDNIGDRGVVMCFAEDSGEFLWQLACPKLGAGKVSDWEYLGICSSATVDEERCYVVTNRCEIICLDVNGLKDGNQGMQDEGKYKAGSGNEPVKVSDKDADIIWVFDMRSDDLGVFPHNIASSSVVVVGDKVFATTSNGVDWSHKEIPAPTAPSFVCLDKNTGKYVGEEGAGISSRIMHCNWSSPATGKVGGKDVIIFGAGDGWCYGFGTTAEPDKDDPAFAYLPTLFKYDCNPPRYRKGEDGTPVKYATFDGPSEVVGTPVLLNNRVYVSIGQDPEHGEGVGMLSCLDATATGDITGKAIWTYDEIERSISTASVQNGLLYLSDYSGRVHCLDAETGEKQWIFDTKGHIWGSTLVADGNVYVGNEEGELYVLAEGREMKKLNLIEFPSPLYSSCVVANDVLYVTTQTHLYAFETKK